MVCAVLLVGGCADTSKVEPWRDGGFTVISNSSVGASSSAAELNKTAKAAINYCNARGLRMSIVNTDTRSGGVATVAYGRVYFRCVAASPAD